MAPDRSGTTGTLVSVLKPANGGAQHDGARARPISRALLSTSWQFRKREFQKNCSAKHVAIDECMVPAKERELRNDRLEWLLWPTT